MSTFAIAIAAIPLALAGVSGQPSALQPATSGAAKPYTQPRTPWGHPDLAGTWTSNGVAGVPVERAKANLTAEDLARQKKEQALREQAGDFDVNVVWGEKPTVLRGPLPASLVVDPPDGRIPLTREAQERLDDWGPTHYGFGIDSWMDLDLWDRCISKGFPTVMVPMAYNNAYQILQTSDYVAILYEIIHDVRVIPLTKRPPVDQRIRQYWGDSRGRWEGNTLVVEVTNFSEKTFGTQQPAGSYRGGGRDMRIVERFTRIADDTIDYRATIEDPKAFTRPWTLAVPLTREDGYRLFEYACHEGNYGLPNILSATRAAEKAGKPGAAGNR